MSTKREEWKRKLIEECDKVFRFWKFVSVIGVLSSIASFYVAQVFLNATSREAIQVMCIVGIIFAVCMLIAGIRTMIITYPPDDLDD